MQHRRDDVTFVLGRHNRRDWQAAARRPGMARCPTCRSPCRSGGLGEAAGEPSKGSLLRCRMVGTRASVVDFVYFSDSMCAYYYLITVNYILQLGVSNIIVSWKSDN